MKRKSHENVDQNEKKPKPSPNSIRERFRYYKQKKSKPKWPEDIVEGVTTFEFPKNNITNKFCKKIDFPNGATLYRNALENSFLEKLGQKCLFEFPLMNDSITNIEKLTGDNIQPSDFEEFDESTLLGGSKLKDLRWTTLGYHHNWDSKKYDENKSGSVPDILNELAEVIQKLTKKDSFKAEASICNYYPAGIGTIGIHTDNSEYCHAPIVSVSLGCDGVFLLGKGDRSDECFEMLLRHGDLFIMDGQDRSSLHAVPRVLTRSESLELDSHWSIPIQNLKLKNYLDQCRININIRQVNS